MVTPNLLLMSGALRKGSYNKMLLREAARAFGDAEVVEADLDLPLYDGDVEDRGMPDSVTRLIDQVRAADALLIGAPEYNKGISGVLKNAIDWLSRVQPWPLRDKPAAVLSAAGGRAGGETGHFMTLSVLAQLQVNVMHGPPILVARPQDEFDENGTLKSDFLKGQIKDRMERLRAAIG